MRMQANDEARTILARLGEHRIRFMGANVGVERQPEAVRSNDVRLHLQESASRTTSGWCLAMRMSVCAAPEGDRRPCSHS